MSRASERKKMGAALGWMWVATVRFCPTQRPTPKTAFRPHKDEPMKSGKPSVSRCATVTTPDKAECRSRAPRFGLFRSVPEAPFPARLGSGLSDSVSDRRLR